MAAFIIALPNKGSLSAPCRRLFSAAGFCAIDESRAYSLNGGSASFIFVRARDIPYYLERGLADAGITGSDVIAERGGQLQVALSLPFGACRLSLAAPTDSCPPYRRIASSFPNLARKYFPASEVVVLDGAVEASVAAGAADAVVDLVASGRTLAANGLVEKAVLLESSAVLVVLPATMAAKGVQISALVRRLEGDVQVFRCSVSGLPKADRSRMLCRGRERSPKVLAVVRDIVSAVGEGRDAAVTDFEKKFDGVDLPPKEFLVSSQEIRNAISTVSPGLLSALKSSAANILRFAQKELPARFEIKMQGGFAGKMIVPLDSVGVYAPGGTASYPSSVLMGVIPAKVAGVGKVVVCTPCNSSKQCNPSVLVAADLAGADEVYRIGGAQAIAALAFGTQSIPRVRKIVGPGNAYVAAAKMEVQALGLCTIDLPAGPSELLIIADDTACAEWVAADMLAQAEHDCDAASVLVTTSEKIAGEVERELKSQSMMLSRRQIVEGSLSSNSAILLAEDLDQAVEFANAYAPEHLQLCVERPGVLLRKVRNAGAVFLGNFSCEAAGDYAAGPNHVLPTGGAARGYSGLSARAFVREMNYLMLQREGLQALKDGICAIAEAEGLEAHSLSVKKRFDGK